ncbi:Na+/H+ antiporter [Sorochytrium milnesiophthora]
MTGIHIDPSGLNMAYTFLGGFIVCFGLFSLLVKDRLYLSETLVAVLVGIMIGPYVAGLVPADSWQPEALQNVIYQLCRVLIAVQVMIAGVELPGKYLLHNWKSLFFLLLPLMVVKWLATGLMVWGILGFSFSSSLVIAACVTPTDPVLANSITKGKYAERHVPPHIRDLLSAESGANDGLGYPFLFIVLYLRTSPSVGSAVGSWLLDIVVYQVLVGVLLGAVIGWGAHRILLYCTNRRWIDKESFLAYGVALSIFIVGFVGFLGSDDLLAAFVAGNAFTWDDWYRLHHEEEHIQNIIDNLLNSSFFIFMGINFPFGAFSGPIVWWRTLLLCIAVLVGRRLPWFLMIYKFVPNVQNVKEALFAGWFGPIGVSALFYAYLLHVQGEIKHLPELEPYIVPLVSALVLSSVVCHGTSIAFFKMTTTITRTLSAHESRRSMTGVRRIFSVNERPTLDDVLRRDSPQLATPPVSAKPSMEVSERPSLPAAPAILRERGLIKFGDDSSASSARNSTVLPPEQPGGSDDSTLTRGGGAGNDTSMTQVNPDMIEAAEQTHAGNDLGELQPARHSTEFAVHDGDVR